MSDVPDHVIGRRTSTELGAYLHAKPAIGLRDRRKKFVMEMVDGMRNSHNVFVRINSILRKHNVSNQSHL